MKKIEAIFKSDIYKAQIAECASRIHRNYKEVDLSFQRLVLDRLRLNQDIKESDSRISLNDSIIDINVTENDRLQFNLGLDKKWGDLERDIKSGYDACWFFGSLSNYIVRAFNNTDFSLSEKAKRSVSEGYSSGAAFR